MKANLDPKYLDAQYNNRALVPDYQNYFDRWQALSRKARQALVCRLDVPYGVGGADDLNQTLDIFPATHSRAPVLVFIHGGYWRSLDKSDHSFVAAPFVQAGACVVVPNYALCPKTDGQSVTIAQITLQMVQALAWTYRNIAKFGGDPRRMVLAGHSAGGHLAAMLLACQWPTYAKDLPKDVIRQAVSLSGLFDLDPIRQTPFLRDSLRLTVEDAHRASPVYLRAPKGKTLHCYVGADESAAFIEQNELLQKHWGRSVVPTATQLAGVNHFSILDHLVQPDGRLFACIEEMMK